MDIEEEIISYLYEYGNTRKSDVINYAVKKLNYSLDRIEKVIKRMVIEGKIHYVVHSKLEPPEVYISLEEPLPPETTKILLEAVVQMKTAKKDAQTILDEAASVAEREVKKRYGKIHYSPFLPIREHLTHKERTTTPCNVNCGKCCEGTEMLFSKEDSSSTRETLL